ncbi:hypothetical protein [Streptomyces wuyuanensis]|uniref:hypothetical protein n=1 Tax=Streptomyces wuyuanensis TaxID=1196353 RepID=UPI00341E112C
MLQTRLQAHREYLLRYGQQLADEGASLAGELAERRQTGDAEAKSELYERLAANEESLRENTQHVTEVQRLLDEATAEYKAQRLKVGLPPAAAPADPTDAASLMLAREDMSVAERKAMALRSERTEVEERITELEQRLAGSGGQEAVALNMAMGAAKSRLEENAEEGEAVEALLLTSRQEYTGRLALPSELHGVAPPTLSEAAIGWFQGPSELEKALKPLTSRPGLYVEPDEESQEAQAGPLDEFASRTQAWLSRQELQSGLQAVALLGRPAARALSGYGAPALEPVGVTGEAPSERLVAARTGYGRALGGEESGAGAGGSEQSADELLGAGLEEEDVLIPAVARLRPLAGPMWVVSSAPGSLGTPDMAVASGKERFEGKEFTPWSENAPHEAPFSRLESALEREAALRSFDKLVDELHKRVGSTVLAGEMSKGTLKSLFSLLTGGVGRFSSTALSGLGSLSMDLTQLALMRGGVKSRSLGVLLGEIKDAPFAKAYEGMKALGEKLSKAAAAAQEKLIHLLEGAPPVVQEAAESIATKAGGIWSTIKEKAQEAFTFIGSYLSSLWEKAKEAWSKLPEFTASIRRAYTKVKEFITDNPYAGKVAKFLEKALANLQANVVDLMDKLSDLPAVTKLLQGLVDSVDKALRETVPAWAFKRAVKMVNEWVAKEGGQFIARFMGGKERFDEHMKGFVGQLSGLTARAREYAISRSLHEGSKTQVGRQITTKHAFLGFRDQSAAFDYALHRASTEPGDRHMMLMHVDLRDWSGRDLGPLLMHSPHHKGQDAILLPGASLLISKAGVIDTPSGRMELLGAIEQVGNLDIRAQVSDPLGNVGWLEGAPGQNSTWARDVLAVSTRALSFRQLAKFVNRYYKGRVEEWVAKLLGDFAAQIWLSFRDWHKVEARDKNQLQRIAAGWIIRYFGFPEELAILAEELISGKGLLRSLQKIREYQRESGRESSFWSHSAVEAVTAILQMMENRSDKQRRIKEAEYTAAFIGSIIGLIELLIKAGPENIVDSVLGTKGTLGAGATAGFAQSVIGGVEGFQVVRRTHGTAAAVAGTAAAQGTILAHGAFRQFNELSKQPAFAIAGQLLPYVPARILAFFGPLGTTASAYSKLNSWVQSDTAQRFVKLPDWGAEQVAAVSSALAAMIAYLPASYFPTGQTVSLSELGNEGSTW